MIVLTDHVFLNIENIANKIKNQNKKNNSYMMNNPIVIKKFTYFLKKVNLK